jgi:hypothetical protein
MRRIWKYVIAKGESVSSFQMPKSAEVISVQIQNGQPVLWIIFDDFIETETREFVVYGTGHDIPDDFMYIGTFQEPPYVWHLFEIPWEKNA